MIDLIQPHVCHELTSCCRQSLAGSVGPTTKDGNPIPVNLGSRFNFVVDRDIIHFYFIDSPDGNRNVIQHYYSGNAGRFYDQREAQDLPHSVLDF